MRTTLLWNPILISFLFAFILVASVATVEEDSSSESLTFELVHRNDPRLPGNENVKFDKFQAIQERTRRDVERMSRRRDLEATIQMPIRAGYDFRASEYFVHVKVGTPPQKFWLVADTGSQLTWIRCVDDRNLSLPTQKSGDSGLPVKPRKGFYPALSQTYRPVTCADPRCTSEDFIMMSADPQCLAPTDHCPYAFKYMSGTVAHGHFGTDIVTLGLRKEIKGTVKDMVVGCTKDLEDHDGGVFNGLTDGVLGLSYLPESFLDRITRQYGNKFSYCFMDHTLPRSAFNFLTFGAFRASQPPNATLLAPMMRTELVATMAGEFGVKVEGVSVGGQMLAIPHQAWDFGRGGGLIIDSGSSLTFLGMPVFQRVVDAFWKPLSTKFKRVTMKIEPFTTCFHADEHGAFQKELPKLAFHFLDGAVFEPPVENYIIHWEGSIWCLALLEMYGPRGEPVLGSMLGNVIQQNFLWEFDLAKSTLGFAPSKCVV